MNLNWVCFRIFINTFALTGKTFIRTTVEPPLTATILQWPICFVPLTGRTLTLYLNLSTTATSPQRQRPLKCVPRSTVKITSRQRPVISATDFKVNNGDMKFDLYSALQARSHGEVRSNEETDQMRPEGQVYGVGGGVASNVWDWIAQQVCNWRSRFERVSVSRLGGSGRMIPRKIF